MSDLRAAPPAASASDRLLPPRAWPVAPWRLALWVACLALAAAAAWLTWTEQRAGDAQGVDAELMLRVAQRWAEAQAHVAAPVPDESARAAPTPSALDADTARVLALIDYQHEREPTRAPAIGGVRETWSHAAQRWSARWRERADAAAAAARWRADAAAMAEASQRLMQTLRERAEARAAATGGGARPGVLLALASVGLLLLGLRRPALHVPTATRPSAPDRSPVSEGDSGASAPHLERLVDASALLARACRDTTSLPRLLLALQVDAPVALLAEIDAGARLELERQIVRRLHAHLGDGDAVALGELGDERIELLVLLQPPRALQPEHVQSLYDDVADAYTVHDHPVRPPMRLGVRELDGAVADATTALREARMACAQAPLGGVLNYSAELGERTAQVSLLAQQLDSALAQGALQVVYRPVRRLVDGAAGDLAGCRAGWRWNHTQHGDLGDADVRQQAAMAGRSALLLQTLQREALSRWAVWQATGRVPAEARIGVPCTLDTDAAVAVQRLLDETGLPGRALELLVDEAGADDTAAAIATVQALRALGAVVTLQGLAQASASLAALPQYRADRVLVARRFVEQLPDHDPHRLLVHAVVSLAATQGLEVHAEGVDTPGQRAALAALGVSAIEGAEAGACTPDSPSGSAFPPA